MNKEQIDEFIQSTFKILTSIDDVNFVITEVNEISKLLKNQDIKNRISYISNEFETNKYEPEEFIEMIIQFLNEAFKDIEFQIPEDISSYFYAEIYGKGFEDIFGYDSQKKDVARSEWEKRIQKRVEGKTDEEKIRMSEEFATTQSEIEEMILLSLSDTKKMELIKQLRDGSFKIKIIISIKDANMKLETLKELEEDNNKIKVIKTIEDVDLILKALKEIGSENLIKQVIEELENSEIKLKVMNANEINEKRKARYEYAKTLDDEAKINELENLDEEQKFNLVRTMQDPKLILEAIDKLEIKNKDVLKRLFEKNNAVVRDIDIRILDDYYIETLGEDKINLITCYSDIQTQILNLKGKQYEIFIRCLDSYLQRIETEEWTIMAECLLENLQSGQYYELIDNIEDIDEIDIEKLSKIMQLSNVVEIKTEEDIKNYEELKRKKCDEIIIGDAGLDEKKNAVFLKIFGQDIRRIEEIIYRYGEDIQCIDDGDEKYYIEALKAIMDIEDEDILKQIYYECEEIGLIDAIGIERRLKSAYGKKFLEGLYTPKEEDIIEEENLPEQLKGLGLKVYDAGTDFRMIITAKKAEYDYKKDWNRPEIKSQHFCTCYISNDMQNKSGEYGIYYGFCQLNEDSLMLLGKDDLNSSLSRFTPRTDRGKEKYYEPSKLLEETFVYNELDFRRMQSGVKKQPDYIVAFRRNNKIEKMEDILKAVNDWGGEIPIVIVDQDRCLEAQKDKENKKENGKKTLSQEQFRESLRQNYDNITPQERKEGVNGLKKLREKIQEIVIKREGEEIEQ